MEDIIYLDNAATTFPKPRQVLDAVERFYTEQGGNPGRSGHRLSIAAGEVVEDARDRVARLINAEDPLQIAFTYNASYALNFAIWGTLEPGDRVLTSPLEHNSVARPLREAERRLGITVEFIEADPVTGIIDLDDLAGRLERPARLVTIVHGSNISGTIQPLSEIGKLTRAAGALLLVDAAQTAGTYPIDVRSMNIDLLAFTGHKGLFGMMGTGGLYVRPGVDLRASFQGGTGSKSEQDVQPDFLPDHLEPGTPNAGGLAALAAGVQFLEERGSIEEIHAYEQDLALELIEGILSIDGARVLGPTDGERLAVVSFTLPSLSVSEIGWRLDEEFSIMARVGLHCCPWGHEFFGTFPEGTVRLSLSIMNTREDVLAAIDAVRAIARG
jgi:cysteine desulfurase/selenocysteine lyase